MSKSVSVLDVIKKIEETIPPGAGLSTLSIDVAEKKVVVSGKASDREDVVAMENRLKSSDFFKKIDSPLNNFLEKKNPSFKFTFYFTQWNLR